MYFDPALEDGVSRWIVTVAHSANGREWTTLDAFPGTSGTSPARSVPRTGARDGSSRVARAPSGRPSPTR
jgi:hypothetical protein